MGLNDTGKIGLRRPSTGNVLWGSGEEESVNFNYTRIEDVIFPDTGGDEGSLRIVAPSFTGLSVPETTAKIFGTIQEAIDDVPVNLETPAIIHVYPGIYNEELEIVDRSVSIYGEDVEIRSGRNEGSASTGKPCITIKLRMGKDSNDDVERSNAEMWALQTHDSRNMTKITFNGISFDNYGRYLNDEPHTAGSIYFMDCTDNGVPPYYGKSSPITFNGCKFRGQTWKHVTDSGYIVGWFQKGFHVRSFNTHVYFNNCSVEILNYGGGTYGIHYFSQIKQPFSVGTDGTSFIGWDMDSGGTTQFTGNIKNANQEYYYNSASLNFKNSDIYVLERYGNWEGAAAGYVGNGWNYGHDSDSSCAIFTLFNMGNISFRDTKCYPSVWPSDDGVGYDPDDFNAEFSNYVYRLDEGVGQASVNPVGNNGADICGCNCTGLTLDGLVLKDNEMINVYGNTLGISRRRGF